MNPTNIRLPRQKGKYDYILLPFIPNGIATDNLSDDYACGTSRESS